MRFISLTMVLIISCLTLLGQQKTVKDGIYQNVIRVKFKAEESAKVDALEANLEIAKQANPNTRNLMVSTGIQKMDALNKTFNAFNIKRVFRNAGKHEDRHRAFGLHLWYEIQFNTDEDILKVVELYSQIDELKIAESRYEVKRIGNVDSHNKSHHKTSMLDSNDPEFNTQWHYKNFGQAGGTPGVDISLEEAWGIETGNPYVVVAIEDGGIDVDHEDLAGNIWVNSGEIPSNGIDDDNNGYVDDVNGFNFVFNSGTIIADDHGTHVAGTIAAESNNGIGVAGIAGGTGNDDGVRLMSCMVFSTNDADGFAEAYPYAADNGAVISQNSWGYGGPNYCEQVVLDGIDYFNEYAGAPGQAMEGGLVIYAAGNDDDNDMYWPGCYDAVLSVASNNYDNEKAWYSNYGSWVDITAPGGECPNYSEDDPEGIQSTYPNNQYGAMMGTSMACPHVSGVAALIISNNYSAITPMGVWERLTQNTDDIYTDNPDYQGFLGSGRLNAYAALTAMPQIIPPTPENLRVASIQSTSMAITWDVVDIAYSYDVQYRSSGQEWTTANTLINSYLIENLTPQTTYEFRVRTINSAGSSPYSPITNGTTLLTDFCGSMSANCSYSWISGVSVNGQSNTTTASNYSDFTGIYMNLFEESSASFTLTPGFLGSGYGVYWRIWIDFNDDGDFEDENELVFDPVSTHNSVVNVDIDIPSGTIGTHRMRITLKEDEAPESCDYLVYGEVEDYTVNIQSTVMDLEAPTAPSDLEVMEISTNQVVLSWTASTDNIGVSEYVIYQDGIQEALTANTTYLINNLLPATNYEFFVKAKDAAGNLSEESNMIQVTTQETQGAYCNSRGLIFSEEWIEQVEIDTISFTSGLAGYTDFTSNIIHVIAGEQVDITLTPGFSTNANQEYWRVWIDYNMDGDFEDANELVFDAGSVSSSPVSGSFTVDTDASGSTRMRISMKKSESPNACEIFSHGEVEDYTVQINTTTDVHKNELTDLIIYPNPAESTITIQGIQSKSMIEIYNISGSVVTKQMVCSNTELNISSLQNGIYVVRIINGEHIYIDKLIKK